MLCFCACESVLCLFFFFFKQKTAYDMRISDWSSDVCSSDLSSSAPESRALLDRLRSEAIATCGSFTFEAEIRRPNGTPRWMRVTADIVERNGRATHLYGTKLDITAQMAAGWGKR